MNRPIYRKKVYFVFLTAALALLTGRADAADKAAELRREQLAKVKRIAVLPLFFGSDTLRDKKPAPEPKLTAKQEKPNKNNPPENPINLEQFRTLLRKMDARANARLPKQIAERTPYTIVNAEEVQEALSQAELKPFELFQNAGMMKGIKFAAPDTDAIKKLATTLKADLFLVGTMEEPRRTNGNASLFSYTAPHVNSRIIYYLLLPDSTDVFHHTADVVRPLSRIGAKDYVMADWLETVDQNIENFLDEVARYTPAKSRQ